MTSARSLNSIFRQWSLRPGNNTWNVTGDPCSGTAVDDTEFNAPNINPSLKCVCSEGICRITQLKVYALDVVGRIPDEFQNLTTIFDLCVPKAC
ncbi:hypothetical protein Taro_034115 [Colocasia esculenta]|uniref:Uncharacterized protein n=1 Tax=Colocasia esculenta TaxID=4460 RepID=A0A843W371_COLES|nr:hypothetical protein [Colocasia esculenta]